MRRMGSLGTMATRGREPTSGTPASRSNLSFCMIIAKITRGGVRRRERGREGGGKRGKKEGRERKRVVEVGGRDGG